MTGADSAASSGRLIDSMALLTKVASTIGPGFKLDEVLAASLEAMRALVGFRGGSIQLLDERGLYVAVSEPPVSEEVRAARLPVGEGLGGRIVASRQPIYSPDIELDDRVPAELRGLGSNAGMRSYLGVPMLCLGEVVGVMQVDSAEPDAFVAADVILLQGLAVQVAAAIESARRFELVMELERLKIDFISRVSHELRTPITIIDGFIETMLTHGERLSADDRQRMLERSRMAAARLSGLIEDLITLARVESGIIAPHLEPTRLRVVLDEAVASASAPERVEVRCADELTVSTDSGLLARMVGFLVDNAIKYGNDPIEVVAEARRAGDDGPAGWWLQVGDAGPGIADDVRTTLFELFTRSANTVVVPGLGLGLPMARTLAALLGGRLDVAARPGGGTLVTFRTPA